MKLNKLLAMSAILACGLSLAACGDSKKSSQEAASTDAKSTQEVQSSQEVKASKVNVGVGYSATYNGTDQVDVTVAFAAFDADGVIKAARLDVVQVKIKANDAGDGLALAVADAKMREDGKVMTKLELGTNYNMVKFGQSIAEVDAQIEAYANWTVGKTADQVKAAMKFETEADGHKEDGYFTTDADLFASCTITVDKFAAAVANAYEQKSAATYDWVDGAKAGVAINAALAYNYGKPQNEVSVDYVGALVADGKVLAASVDAVVASFTVAEGAYSLNKEAKYHKGSTDEALVFLSKKTLGADYAMAPASPIGAEWDAQAVAMEAGFVGKSAEEIAALTEISGATITISSYVSAAARAAQYAVLEHVGPQAE